MCDTHACVCSAKHIRKSTLRSVIMCASSVCLRPRVCMCGCELTCVCDDDEDEEEAWGGVASGRR